MNHKRGVINNGLWKLPMDKPNPFVSVSLKELMCYQYINFATFKFLSLSGITFLNSTSSKFPAPQAKTLRPALDLAVVG